LVLTINKKPEARRANKCTGVDMMFTVRTDRDHVAESFAAGTWSCPLSSN